MLIIQPLFVKAKILEIFKQEPQLKFDN